MGIFLAMYGNKVSIGEAFFISIFAMIVVFIVLLIISYIIDITAFFLKCSKKQQNDKKSADLNKNVNVNVSSVENVKVDDSSLVAVIASVVATTLGTSVDNLRITKIRRIKQNTTAWNNHA